MLHVEAQIHLLTFVCMQKPASDFRLLSLMRPSLQSGADLLRAGRHGRALALTLAVVAPQRCSVRACSAK